MVEVAEGDNGVEEGAGSRGGPVSYALVFGLSWVVAVGREVVSNKLDAFLEEVALVEL